MIVVFVVFAAISALAAWLLPYAAPGIGIDMMLIYGLLAVITAVLGLLRRRKPR
ncbi:hypothetical protein [Lichenicoccus sp.]|uniref:hypothetical protein n=1 Tax=Lichenicoccus sp. TaxID=2781899 RepID=UPI003D0FB28E